MKLKKLVIPKEGFTKEQIEQIADRDLSIVYLVKNQGRIYEDIREELPNFPDFCWEEIKDEPMSAEEAWEECQYCCDMDYSQTEGKSIFFEGFNAGAAENEKTHREAIKITRDWFRNGRADDWKKLDEYLKKLPEDK